MRTLILLNSNRIQHSETFIQNHIENIATTTLNLYYFGKGEPNYKMGGFKKYQHYILSALNYYKFKKTVKENNIQVVLAEYGMVGADAVEYCRRLKLPLVVHFHGHDAHRKTIIEKYNEKYKILFEYAAAIVVVSNKMRQSIIDLGASPNKVILNVYGVKTGEINLNQINRKKNQVFAVGRFVDKKAPYLLILSFEKVLAQLPNAQLYIAGSGYLFETCQRIIIAKKLNKSIFLIGELAHQEVLKMMKESAIFIQHSVEAFDGDAEGTPNSILEASAAGMPIVATAHAGISDVIQNNISGMLVEEGDIDTMAEKIIYLLSEPEFAQNIGIRAQQEVEMNYEINQSLNKLKSILNDSISKNTNK